MTRRKCEEDETIKANVQSEWRKKKTNKQTNKKKQIKKNLVSVGLISGKFRKEMTVVGGRFWLIGHTGTRDYFLLKKNEERREK